MNRFQVDLTGMVDLLSRHLYSGPQVYVRELMQNGVDAITARRQLDPKAPARIAFLVTPDGLEVRDSGVGLTAAEAEDLLSTIGRSSKREPQLGLARSDYIGQFGIGMLAAFMVSAHIEVVSRSARSDAPTMCWDGYADGTFSVRTLPPEEGLSEPGTRVRLTARDGMREWLSFETVSKLARDYGGLLPFPVSVRSHTGQDAGLNWSELPWRVPYPSRSERTSAMDQYCEAVFGFKPLGHIDLDVPMAGLSGVAFILPDAVAPGMHAHRVYVKRMLLSDRTERLLPDWAFFVRVVADSTLSPTASREALHDDELLEATREALGAQLRAWAQKTLVSGSRMANAFIATHHLALRSLALGDDEMLELVAQVLPYETTDGPMTLAEAARRGELVYTTTTEAYRRVATVARAQNLVVVNAGYVYDADILARLRSRGWTVRELGAGDLVQVLRELNPARAASTVTALRAARQLLSRDDCDVVIRAFEPAHVPAVLLQDREGEFRRDLRTERAQQDGAWGALLGALDTAPAAGHARTLVLNDEAPVVRQLLAASGPVFEAGLTSLYLSAVMLAGEGLRAREVEAMNDALAVLLRTSLVEVMQ